MLIYSHILWHTLYYFISCNPIRIRFIMCGGLYSFLHISGSRCPAAITHYLLHLVSKVCLFYYGLNNFVLNTFFRLFGVPIFKTHLLSILISRSVKPMTRIQKVLLITIKCKRIIVCMMRASTRLLLIWMLALKCDSLWLRHYILIHYNIYHEKINQIQLKNYQN